MTNEYSLHYYNSHALLMVNTQGIIRVLYTPFRVQCIDAIASIPENTSVYVEEVFCTEKDELRYMILGAIYSYKNFQLLSNF